MRRVIYFVGLLTTGGTMFALGMVLSAHHYGYALDYADPRTYVLVVLVALFGASLVITGLPK